MAITPNRELKKLKEEFGKADKNEKRSIVKRIMKEGNFYLNKYYDYDSRDIKERAGYDMPPQLIGEALLSGPNEIISEVTGISKDDLDAISNFDEIKEEQEGKEEKHLDYLELLMEINEIDEVKELMSGRRKAIKDIETKKKIGKIAREFRSKHFDLEISRIIPFSEEYLRECEGLYFKEQCVERENCVYKNYFK